MQVRLKPVYSRLAEMAEVASVGLAERLPIGADGAPWRLSRHQVTTYRSLTAVGGPDIVFNTALTGDGKSLAGQLPALMVGWRRKLFAMYPTNELIRDQQRQAQTAWQTWNQYPSIAALDSAELDRRMESGDFDQRGAALTSVIKNHDVLLTNPDIFHYIMQSFYVRAGKHGDAADKVFAPLIDAYQQFTFDEFHIFETPQVVSIVTALLLMDEVTRGRPRQFLFQSATPNPLMLRYLDRAGLTAEIIRGEYLHANQGPDPEQWRLILRGCDLHFASGTVDEWLDLHFHDCLLPFFLAHKPGAKGAIIVNSVAQARRLVLRLRSDLAAHGITVGENTGLTSRSQRIESYTCDLLVGTSTVDVGVDFQINFLLFESRDAGSFLQRLGRLGRHAAYQDRNGASVSFQDSFVAHALVPPWIEECLFLGRNKEPALLVNGAEIDREALIAAIDAAYPPPATFESYARDWGSLQATRVVHKLNGSVVRSQYESVRKNLIRRYGAAFGVSIVGQSSRYAAMLQNQPKLHDEVTSFRGGSSFICALLDASEQGADQIKTYDLFSLVGSGELGALDEAEFWAAVQRWQMPEQPLRRQEPVAFFRLLGFRPEREQFRVKLKQDIADWGSDRLGVVQLLNGVQLHSESPQSIPNYNLLNRRLALRHVPAVLCLRFHPLELKRRLRLPMLFAVHEFESRDGLRGSIAFDRAALLLHTALKQQRIDCGGNALIL